MGINAELSRLQLLSSRYKNKSRMCPFEITKEEEQAFLIFNYIQELKIEKRNFAKYQSDWEKLKDGLRSLYDFDEGVVSIDYLECVKDTLEKMKELEYGSE